MSNLKETSLFELMMLVVTLVKLPILIPSLLGFFVKKTPDWAGWGTIVVGAIVSYIVAFIITPEMIERGLNLTEPLTRREFSDLRSVTLGISFHMLITVPFYLISTFFYKGHEGERKIELETFFNNVSTEVVAEYVDENELDNKQRFILGKLIQVVGVAIACLCIVPNLFWGRLVFIIVGFIVILVGTALKLAVSKSNKNDTINIFGHPSTKGMDDDNLWIYIERTMEKGKLLKLGRNYLTKNNVLVLEFNEYGILKDKKLSTIENMQKLAFAEDITENEIRKENFIYGFLSSVRQKMQIKKKN